MDAQEKVADRRIRALNRMKERTQKQLVAYGYAENVLPVRRKETMGAAIQRAVDEAKAVLPIGTVFEIRGRLPGERPAAAWFTWLKDQDGEIGMFEEPQVEWMRGITIYGRLKA